MEQDLHEDEIDVEEDEIDVEHEYDSDELDRDDMLRNRDGGVNFVWDGWWVSLIYINIYNMCVCVLYLLAMYVCANVNIRILHF